MDIKKIKEEKVQELQKAENTYQMLLNQLNAVNKRIVELNAEINLLSEFEEGEE